MPLPPRIKEETAAADSTDRQSGEIGRYSARAPVTASGGTGTTLMPESYTLVMPDPETRYMVTESQIIILETGGKYTALEWSLFSGGAALGLLPNFLQTLVKFVQDNDASRLEIILAIVFAGFVTNALVRWLEHRRNSTNVQTLIAKIKAGQEVKVE